MGNITETIVFEKLEADEEELWRYGPFDVDVDENGEDVFVEHSTDIDLDRDVPDIIWEPEYLGDR